MALSLKKRDLSKYDIECGLDISPSMDERDTPSGKSRIADSRETVSLLVKEAGEIDTDGITFFTFDSALQDVFENTTNEKAQKVVANARANGNGTCHASALAPRVDDYLDQLLGKPAVKGNWLGRGGSAAVPANPNTKPRIFVIITDGQPTSSGGEQKLRDLIIGATKRLKAAGYGREKIGFSFIQTGRDAHAKAFLNELNNNLDGAAFDCVNCVTIDECKGLNTKQILEKALDD